MKTIVYLILFFFIFKFLARLLLPLLVKKVVEKAGENFQHYSHQHQNTTFQNKDEVQFDTTKYRRPRETKKVGEYVDYEEID